jgi:hypothetical protein
VLACVASADADLFIRKAFDGELQHGWIWIGLYQDNEATTANQGWHWMSGCTPEQGYSNWQKGEPNWYSEKEQCAFIGYKTDGGQSKWYDGPCKMHSRCLCEAERPFGAERPGASLVQLELGLKEYSAQADSHGGVDNYDHSDSIKLTCQW